jgi:hypothetical protein
MKKRSCDWLSITTSHITVWFSDTYASLSSDDSSISSLTELTTTTLPLIKIAPSVMVVCILVISDVLDSWVYCRSDVTARVTCSSNS